MACHGRSSKFGLLLVPVPFTWSICCNRTDISPCLIFMQKIVNRRLSLKHMLVSNGKTAGENYGVNLSPLLSDSIGSVAFNPVDANLLSVSGSRHFNGSPNVSDSDSSDSSDSESLSGQGSHARNYVRRRRQPVQPHVVDSSVKIWKFSPGEPFMRTSVDAPNQNENVSEDSGIV